MALSQRDAFKSYLRRDRVHDSALTMLLIVQCWIIAVAAPLAAIGGPGSRVLLELLILAFAFIVFLISRGTVATAVASFAIASGLTGSTLQFWAPSNLSLLLAHGGTLTAMILVCYIVGRAVLAPGEITGHRVLGAIALYLNFGILFATAYRLVWDFVPGSLSGIPAGLASWKAYGSMLYFSLVTLTSVGYGDIVPVHPFARTLSNLEAIVGQLYPATLLARLITLELERHHRR
jgi:voltage-gated potassium channel Kch